MKAAIRTISSCCVYSTILTTILCFYMEHTDNLTNPAIRLDQYWIILLFSFLLASCNLLFLLKQLPKSVLQVLHFILSCACFCLVFIVAGKITNVRPGTIFVFIFIYAIIYAVVLGAKLLVDHLFKNKDAKKQQSESEYKPLYK